MHQIGSGVSNLQLPLLPLAAALGAWLCAAARYAAAEGQKVPIWTWEKY